MLFRTKILLMLTALFLSSCITGIGSEIYSSGSLEKHAAMREIQRIYTFALNHRESIKEIAGYLEYAEFNFDAIVLAAAFSVRYTSNTGAFVEIAGYASQSADFNDKFEELLRLSADADSGQGLYIDAALDLSRR